MISALSFSGIVGSHYQRGNVFKARLLIASQPTRGVDIGATGVHCQQIVAYRDAGNSAADFQRAVGILARATGFW